MCLLLSLTSLSSSSWGRGGSAGSHAQLVPSSGRALCLPLTRVEGWPGCCLALLASFQAYMGEASYASPKLSLQGVRALMCPGAPVAPPEKLRVDVFFSHSRYTSGDLVWSWSWKKELCSKLIWSPMSLRAKILLDVNSQTKARVILAVASWEAGSCI